MAASPVMLNSAMHIIPTETTLPTPLMLRPLDPGEAFFYLSDRVSCMNFVVFAERVGALQPERIQSALDALQHDNLLLQTSIQWTEEHGLYFASVPGVQIDLAFHTVAADHWQGAIEQQLSSPFAAATGPLMRCLYLDLQTPIGAGHCVLALCFHHSVADGRAGIALLRQLLALMTPDAVTSPATGPGMLPAMVAVHPDRFRWADQAEAAGRLKTTLITDYRRHGPLPVVPWLAREAEGRTPRFIRLRFAPEVTLALRSLARDQGSSLHGALCAAQLLAQHGLQPGLETTPFFLSCPVDMRPHLEPVQPDTPTGLFVSLISATFAISATTDFWTLARDIMVQTRRQIARGEGHLLFQLFGLDGSVVPPGQLAAFTKKSLASLPNTMVSNVGAIATVAQDPAVTAISFTLCPMPYQTLFTAASSYQGQLLLNVGFDAARLSEANAHALTQSMQSILLSAANH